MPRLATVGLANLAGPQVNAQRGSAARVRAAVADASRHLKGIVLRKERDEAERATQPDNDIVNGVGPVRRPFGFAGKDQRPVDAIVAAVVFEHGSEIGEARTGNADGADPVDHRAVLSGDALVQGGIADIGSNQFAGRERSGRLPRCTSRHPRQIARIEAAGHGPLRGSHVAVVFAQHGRIEHGGASRRPACANGPAGQRGDVEKRAHQWRLAMARMKSGLPASLPTRGSTRRYIR